MTDPVMQSILQQAQGNPQALQDHMKNPTVRNKIMKLINAGIIKTDRKSTRLNSSHITPSRMPSSA